MKNKDTKKNNPNLNFEAEKLSHLLSEIQMVELSKAFEDELLSAVLRNPEENKILDEDKDLDSNTISVEKTENFKRDFDNAKREKKYLNKAKRFSYAMMAIAAAFVFFVAGPKIMEKISFFGSGTDEAAVETMQYSEEAIGELECALPTNVKLGQKYQAKEDVDVNESEKGSDELEGDDTVGVLNAYKENNQEVVPRQKCMEVDSGKAAKNNSIIQSGEEITDLIVAILVGAGFVILLIAYVYLKRKKERSK